MAIAAPQPTTLPGLGFLEGSTGKNVGLALGAVAAALGAWSLVSMFSKDQSGLNDVLEAYADPYAQSPAAAAAEGVSKTAFAKNLFVRRAVEITEGIAERQGALGRTEALMERADMPLRAGEALTARATDLIYALGEEPSSDAANGLLPEELAGCVTRTLALSEVAAVRPSLLAEFPVYDLQQEGSKLVATAGIADALTVDPEGRPIVVIDWKSDVDPTEETLDHYRAQVRAHLYVTDAERGLIVMKFWLHIDRETQAERFQERVQTGYKKYKLTEEDHRNRLRWDDYKAAANEMIARTSTEISHWRLVAANDKRFARVRVIESEIGRAHV